MRNWQFIVVVLAVIVSSVGNAIFVRAKTDDAVARIEALASDNQESMNRRLAEIHALATSACVEATTASKTVNARCDQLTASITEKLDISTSRSIAEVTRRLDALEETINRVLAAIGARERPPHHAGAIPVDLSGQWESTTPGGTVRRASIARLDDNRYKLGQIGVFNGIYELRNDRLVVIEPTDERLTEWVWRVVDENTIVLIQSSLKTGADYSGATLKRVHD